MALTKNTPAASAPVGVRTAETVNKHIRGRVPTKENINFAQISVKHTRWWLVLLTVVLILAVGGAIGKFLIYDRYQAVDAAEAEAAAMHRALDECNARIEAYGELNETYAHYTYTGMTEEELGRVDRVAVLDLMQRVLFVRTEVTDWSVRGNVLSLDIAGDTLQEINETVQQLMAEPLVNYCEVNTAATDMKWDGYWRLRTDQVTASVLVYLNKLEEGTEQ